jgi:hypothetical protein
MLKRVQKVGFVLTEAPPRKRAALLLRRVLPERKGCAVYLDHKASEDLAKVAVWSEKSLRYARERNQRKLVLLLGAVKTDLEFEGALHALPPGEHLVPARGGYQEEPTDNNDRGTGTADDVRKREPEQEKVRARVAAWELFMETERQELRLRQDGQLGRLLGEPQPGEPPAALERLAAEDRRQAQDGLVALMSMGKVSYKHLDELSPKDMPARVAANRLRTTWLKERRDGWLARGPGGSA